jgi:hypothetical protein
MNASRTIWNENRAMISANVNSAFGVDLLVSDDYWIKHDQLAARDGRCVLGKRLS